MGHVLATTPVLYLSTLRYVQDVSGLLGGLRYVCNGVAKSLLPFGFTRLLVEFSLFTLQTYVYVTLSFSSTKTTATQGTVVCGTRPMTEPPRLTGWE